MEGLMAGLGAMFFIGLIFFLIVTLVVVTAILRAVGKAFNAGNYGWGICLLVVILSSIAGGLVGAVASSIHPALGILGSLFVHTALVSTLMHAPMVAAFVITLVSQIVFYVLLFLAALVLALILGGSIGDITGIGSSTETHTIRNPDGSVTTYEVTTDSSGRVRTKHRTVKPGGGVIGGISDGKPSVLSNEAERDGSKAFESELVQKKLDEAAAAAELARKRTPRFEFLETLPESLGQKIGREARITLRDGREHEGTIRGVTEGSVQLEKRVSGGKMLFPINVSSISAASVRERVED